MAAMRRAHRSRAQLPSCYYEGFLEKRSFKDKTSRRLWAALCGDALFFYNNSKDCDYVEKQELSSLISLNDDPSLDRKLDAARLHLRLKDDDIYLTAPSLEARELWKGYILSVVKREVPACLNLLPGQVHMLREAVEKENERLKEIAEKAAAAEASKAAATSNEYTSVQCDMPACFYRMNRIETEMLLEKHKNRGNLLLRPSRDGTCFAVTTLQDFNGPVFRHYRVTRIPDGGFAIAVDNPVSCNTLHEVINYLIEKTGGAYKPLVLEHTYEESIEYVEDNMENGEKSVRSASSSPVLPTVAPKPAPRSRRSDQPENIYQNSSEEEDNYVKEDECGPPPVLPRAPVRSLVHQTSMPDLQIGPGGALLPPNARPRRASVTTETKPRCPASTVPVKECFPLCFNEELKKKVQLRAVSE